MMLRRIVFLLLTTLVAFILLNIGGATAGNDAVIRHFLDTTRGTAFTLHVDPIDPNYGRFSFSIAGVGTYVGGNRDAIRQMKKGGIAMNFKGEAQFFSESDLENPGVSRNVNLSAKISSEIGRAKSKLKDHQSGSSYRMVGRAPPGNAEQVVTEVMTATETSNWEALYGLISSTFVGDTTLEEFAAHFSAQEAEFGRVVGVELLSEPDIRLSPIGNWFFTIRTRVTFDTNGSLETDEFTDVYILEDGEWKFWFSVAD